MIQQFDDDGFGFAYGIKVQYIFAVVLMSL